MKKSNINRKKLIELSETIRKLKKQNHSSLPRAYDMMTMNEIIKTMFYPEGEYKTFKGWKDQGMKIKKGSKGFPIWGKPIRGKGKTPKDGECETKEERYKFFPVCILFHEKQTEKA